MYVLYCAIFYNLALHIKREQLKHHRNRLGHGITLNSVCFPSESNDNTLQNESNLKSFYQHKKKQNFLFKDLKI